MKVESRHKTPMNNYIKPYQNGRNIINFNSIEHKLDNSPNRCKSSFSTPYIKSPLRARGFNSAESTNEDLQLSGIK